MRSREPHAGAPPAGGGRQPLLLLLGVVVLVLGGCGDDDGPAAPADDPDQFGVLSGVVTDVAGDPVAGAVVTADGATAVTSETGYFVTRRAPLGDVAVRIDAAGHAPNYRRVFLATGRTVHLTDIALRAFSTGVIDADTGGEVTAGDGAATLAVPAGALVTLDGLPYTGEATVELAAIMPGDPRFHDLFPGDFTGLRLDGRDQPLVCWGVATINLTGSGGQVLDLAAEANATLTTTIPASQDDPPPSLPAWWFDGEQAEWREGPVATREGDTFTVAIPTTATWNLGAPVENICALAGVVHDGTDRPVAGVRVVARSLDRAFRSEVATGPGGAFEVRALTSGPTEVWAISGTLAGERRRIEVADQCPQALAAPLVLPVPEFTATLTWGDEPADLDAHLLVPAVWTPDADYAHVHADSPGGHDDWPYAALDRDAIAGHGPEVVTGSRILEGRYQLWIHDASTGDSATLHASGAVVQLEVRGQLHLFRADQVDLADGDPSGWWHVTDLLLIDGEATVDPVMAFQPRFSEAGMIEAR